MKATISCEGASGVARKFQKKAWKKHLHLVEAFPNICRATSEWLAVELRFLQEDRHKEPCAFRSDRLVGACKEIFSGPALEPGLAMTEPYGRPHPVELGESHVASGNEVVLPLGDVGSPDIGSGGWATACLAQWLAAVGSATRGPRD